MWHCTWKKISALDIFCDTLYSSRCIRFVMALMQHFLSNWFLNTFDFSQSQFKNVCAITTMIMCMRKFALKIIDVKNAIDTRRFHANQRSLTVQVIAFNERCAKWRDVYQVLNIKDPFGLGKWRAFLFV